MSIHEDEATDHLAVTAPTGPSRFFKLPVFWTASPAAWFGVTEAQFLLRGTMTQQDRFDLIAAVLPKGGPHPMATTTSGLLSW